LLLCFSSLHQPLFFLESLRDEFDSLNNIVHVDAVLLWLIFRLIEVSFLRHRASLKHRYFKFSLLT
jgi:hypothetical protein